MKSNRVLTLLLCLLAVSCKAFSQYFEETYYTPEFTVFKLFAPSDSKSVMLRIYNEGIGGEPLKTFKMKKTGKDTWILKVKKDLKNKFYTFEVVAHKKSESYGETAGIFAKAVGVNGKRAAIIDMNETNPEGWEHDKRIKTNSPADIIIYEMHHRDFSIDMSSGLKNKGKFLALTEQKAITHLTELGINAVHILPSFDYASVDETKLYEQNYNWGYDPLNYNVPEGSYSTDPYTPSARIREFKQMVQALHNAGIRVILDVVYNHTFDISGSAFQRTYPDYFYRKTANGDYSNGSGCGNETASERDMMRKFIIESVKYWINEYHIDGFRFDLMGVHDIETMNEIRSAVNEIDSSVFIYGEGWNAGSCAYPTEKLGMKANISMMPGIAAFSDEIRDALRGPFNNDEKGAFLAGISGEEESLKAGIAGMIDHPQVDYSKVNYSKKAWAKEPTQMISYVSCHDDMCLTDRLRASIPGISMEELIRLDLLAQTAVFTSQGIPFMLSGEEMLRDKKGVRNSFASPDSVNRLDWDNMKRYPHVFDYCKKLISLRKNHPAFRLGSADLVRKHLEFMPLGNGIVGFILKNHAGGDAWNDIVVILNANKEAVTVDIPQGKFTVVCCDGIIDENGLGEMEGGKVNVDSQSALILHD